MATIWRFLGLCACVGLTSGMSLADDQIDCGAYPAPVISLDFGSPYRADSEFRNVMDPDAKERVEEALSETDDYIRYLSRTVTTLFERSAIPYPELSLVEQIGACVETALMDWAYVDALGRLDSFNANLTFGSRLAAIAINYSRIRDDISDSTHKLILDAWLRSLAWRQVLFWETQASEGARQGNLRAWAALGLVVVGTTLEDQALITEGVRGHQAVLCSAQPDGSLPIEMRRGRYALFYQNHATMPLVVTTAWMRHQAPADLQQDLRVSCDNALERVVSYTLDDLVTGETSQAYSGEEQSFFDGTATIEQYMMAWLPALYSLEMQVQTPDPSLLFSTAYNSKLGGDQMLVWGAYFPADHDPLEH